MRKVTLTKDTRGYTLVFVWHGGPYIDVHFDSSGTIPFDVINVWNYETSEPVIPFEQKAMREHCREWVAENFDELDNYWENRP